jgi:hypothetical protein
MLKYDVTYTNLFTEEEVTETLYFNLSRAEIVELMVSDPQYLDAMAAVAKRADAGDESAGADLMVSFKDLLKRSYGLRTADNQFQKTAEISELFLAGPAYDKFLWELMMNPDQAIEFFTKIFPVEIVAEARAQGKFQPQDHLPKRTKNVFNEADLADYIPPAEAEGTVIPEEPISPHEDEYDSAEFEAYKKWRSEQF